MEGLILETKIIDSKEVVRFNKFKAKVGTIHAIIIGILFIGMYSKNSESLLEKLNFPIFVSALLIALLAIGSTFLVAFIYVKVPSKGKLQFYEDFLILKIKNKNSTIKLAELSKLSFYINKGRYFIGIIKKKKESILEVDIVFQNEKRIINKIVENWSKKGFHVEIIKNDELQRKARLKKKKLNNKSNTDIVYNFTNYKVKIEAGFPFKAKVIIPYNKISKKVLFVLSIESIENLNWEVIDYYSEGIRGVTDSVFQLLGNRFLILFKEELMVITCEDNGNGLFPLGAKEHIRDLLVTMSELSNELDFKILEEKYEKMFNKKSQSI